MLLTSCFISTLHWHRSRQDVVDRRLVFCEFLATNYSTPEMIMECKWCKEFTVRCCQHRDESCHHWRLIFTDGASSNNGSEGAVAGIGVAMGSSGESQWSIPVTGDIDPLSHRRTSQRTELLAALEGFHIACELSDSSEESIHKPIKEKVFIIATDSEYVVKGITEWLPDWKVGTQLLATCLLLI